MCLLWPGLTSRWTSHTAAICEFFTVIWGVHVLSPPKALGLPSSLFHPTNTEHIVCAEHRYKL